MIEAHPTFKDNRGSFTPIDCKDWEQVNISVNDKRFTFRGMHYQTSPPQTKFIKVVKGSIIDILYNLETQESSFYILDEDDALLVDKKFAHGFLTLEPNTIVSYLVKGAYNPSSEHTIYWKDIPRVKKEILNLCGDDSITISAKDDQPFDSENTEISPETAKEKSLRLACEAFFEGDDESLKSTKCTWIRNMVEIAKSIVS